jgi:hypothetical protein
MINTILLNWKFALSDDYMLMVFILYVLCMPMKYNICIFCLKDVTERSYRTVAHKLDQHWKQFTVKFIVGGGCMSRS